MQSDDEILTKTALSRRHSELKGDLSFIKAFSVVTGGVSFLFGVFLVARPLEAPFYAFCTSLVVTAPAWLLNLCLNWRVLSLEQKARKQFQVVNLTPEAGFTNTAWGLQTRAERKRGGFRPLTFKLRKAFPDLEIYEGPTRQRNDRVDVPYLITKNGINAALARVVGVAGETVWVSESANSLLDGEIEVTPFAALAQSHIVSLLEGSDNRRLEIIGVGLQSSVETSADLARERAVKLAQSISQPEFQWSKDPKLDYWAMNLGRSLKAVAPRSSQEQRQRAAVVVVVSRLIDAHAQIDFEDTLQVLVAHANVRGTELSEFEGWSLDQRLFREKSPRSANPTERDVSAL